RFGVSRRIVDGDFVLHRLHVRTRELFNEVKLFGMRQTTVIKPEFLVDAVDLANLLATIGVDDSAVAVAAAEKHQNAIEVGIFDELEAVDLLKLSRASGRLAGQVHRVILQEIALAK